MTTELATIEPQNTVTPELLAAVNAVMKAVGYVQKTGEVTGGGARYKYAGEADILAAIRPAMVDNGLMIFPVEIQSRNTEELHFLGADKRERTVHRTDLQVVYRLYHIGGGYIDMPHCGRGDDSGDKSYGKAETYACKYAYRQAFGLETGNDPDKDASPEPGQEARKLDVKRVKVREADDFDHSVPPPQYPAKRAETPASAPKPTKQGSHTTERPCDAHGEFLPLRAVTIEAGSAKPTSTGKARYSFKLAEIDDWAGCFDTGMVERALGADPAHYRGLVYMNLFQKGTYWNFDWVQIEPPLDADGDPGFDPDEIELGPPLNMDNLTMGD